MPIAVKNYRSIEDEEVMDMLIAMRCIFMSVRSIHVLPVGALSVVRREGCLQWADVVLKDAEWLMCIGYHAKHLLVFLCRAPEQGKLTVFKIGFSNNFSMRKRWRKGYMAYLKRMFPSQINDVSFVEIPAKFGERNIDGYSNSVRMLVLCMHVIQCISIGEQNKERILPDILSTPIGEAYMNSYFDFCTNWEDVLVHRYRRIAVESMVRYFNSNPQSSIADVRLGINIEQYVVKSIFSNKCQNYIEQNVLQCFDNSAQITTGLEAFSYSTFIQVAPEPEDPTKGKQSYSLEFNQYIREHLKNDRNGFITGMLERILKEEKANQAISKASETKRKRIDWAEAEWQQIVDGAKNSFEPG